MSVRPLLWASIVVVLIHSCQAPKIAPEKRTP